MSAAQWWQRDLELHRQQDGRCPVCGTARRCWAWATAFAASIVERQWPRP